jgi:hypothetical protein
MFGEFLGTTASRMPRVWTEETVSRYGEFVFQWLFQPIQGPGLLFSSVIFFHRR